MTDTDRAVDVRRDGLERRLVLTADRQPNVALISLDQPAVRVHRGRQRNQGEKQKDQGSDGHFGSRSEERNRKRTETEVGF